MTETQKGALGQTMTGQTMTDQTMIEVGIVEVDRVSLAEVIETEMVIEDTHAGKLIALYIANKSITHG